MKYRSHLALVKTQLGPLQFDVLHSEMYRLGRHTLTAYTLWGLLGWSGVHQWYLGKPWKGALYVVATIAAVGAVAAHYLLPEQWSEPYHLALKATALGAGALWLFFMTIDLFSLHRQVDLCNERIEDQIIMALVEQAEPAAPPVRRGGRGTVRPLYFE